MPDNPYILAQKFRAALVARDVKASLQISRAYKQVLDALLGDVAALQRKMLVARDAGEKISPAWLLKERRLQTLLAQATDQFNLYGQRAGQFIIQQQGREVEHSIAEAQRLLAATGAEFTFDRLPTATIESLVGFSGDGSPLHKLLAEIPGDAAKTIKETLLTSLARGINPRQTAREMTAALDGNRARALTIARTETLRAYREAGRQTAERAGVGSWQWIASKSRRTCLACIALDGQVFPIEQPQPSHPNCRCTVLYLPPGYNPPAREYGAQWFEKQPDEVKQAMMSKVAFEAYQRGDVKLQDFVGIRKSKAWGETRYERSFKDASKFAKQRTLQSGRKAGISADVTIGKFTSLTDATAWAQQQYPQIAWDFTGAAIETINPTLAQFHKLAQAYPDVANRLEYFGTYKGANSPRRYFWRVGDFAHATRDGKWIGLNPLDYSDAGKLSATLKDLEEIGHFAPGSAAIEYLITHEFGHHVENWLRSLTQKAVLDVVSADGTGLVEGTFALWQKKHQTTIKLSLYARKNEQEGWAEGFAAQYHTPKAQWTSYVKDQRQLLKALDVTLHKEAFQWYSDIRDQVAREKARDLINALRKRLGL